MAGKLFRDESDGRVLNRHPTEHRATRPREIKFMTDYRVAAGEASEDQVTAAIEKVTSQVPSSIYLALAIASILTSVSFQVAKKKHEALFVGQWVAPFLLLGIYNKLVKQHGSDAATRGV